MLSSGDSQEVVLVNGRYECGGMRVEGCRKEDGGWARSRGFYSRDSTKKRECLKTRSAQ